LDSATAGSESADTAGSTAAPAYTRSHAMMHFLMLVATFCWAANIVAGKEALRGLGPAALAQLRALGAGLAFFLVFRAWRARPAIRLAAREWLLMAALGLSGVTLNQFFFIAGLSRTSVAHTGLIVSLGPVMVLFVSCLVRLEGLTALKLVGMLVSFGGVAVLTVGHAAQVSGAHWQGDLIILASSAAFACYTILVKKVSDRCDALTLNTLVFGLGAVLLAPLGTPAVLDVRWSALSSSVGWSLAYMIVFGSVVPYLIYALALTELAASRVAAFSYLQPVIATALAIWLLAERLTLRAVIGGALILLGVYLTERERGEGD
jgi:drug/metabolite transporter (DMT)-like permease